MNHILSARFLILLATCAAITTPAKADVVSEWIAAAKENNAALARTKAEAKAAFARVPQAKSLPDPTVEVGSTGFQEEIGAFQYARLAQAFPWPGTLGARQSAASLEARARWLQIQALELEVVSKVRVAAADLAFLAKEAELIGVNISLFEKQMDYLEQISRGGGDVSDLVRVEMESGLLNDDLQRNAERITRRLAELGSVVGRPIERGSLKRLSFPDSNVKRKSEAEWLGELSIRNPTLQALASRTEAARAGIRVARLENYPEFMLGAGYRNFVGPQMGGGTDRRSEATVMFSISLPIWGEKNEGKRDEASAMLEAAVQQHEDASQLLRARLVSLLSNNRDATRRAVLFANELLPKAKQAHEAVETSYRAGKASLLDVFDSRRRLLDVETEMWRSKADQYMSRAEIDALFGTEIQTISRGIQ